MKYEAQTFGNNWFTIYADEAEEYLNTSIRKKKDLKVLIESRKSEVQEHVTKSFKGLSPTISDILKSAS